MKLGIKTFQVNRFGVVP